MTAWSVLFDGHAKVTGPVKKTPMRIVMLPGLQKTEKGHEEEPEDSNTELSKTNKAHCCTHHVCVSIVKTHFSRAHSANCFQAPPRQTVLHAGPPAQALVSYAFLQKTSIGQDGDKSNVGWSYSEDLRRRHQLLLVVE